MSNVILEKLKIIAKTNGFSLSKNANNIAKAKSIMFDEKDWYKCPCDAENYERFCCSQLCQSDVRAKGKCHCNLYLRND